MASFSNFPMKKLLTMHMVSFISLHAIYSQQNAIVQSSILFPLQEKHCHGSSLVALPNGDYLAVWFYGSGERTADDVKIMGSRLKNGEKDWATPFEMADTPNIPDCNPVLFLNSENKLFLVWIAVQANKWEQSILRFKTSTDFLKSGAPNWNWQDNILLKPGELFEKEVEKKLNEIPESGRGWAGYAAKYDEMIIAASKDATKRSIGWMTRIKPLLMENGRIVLPLYSDGFNMSMMAISEDNGKSWHPSLPLVGRGPIQPAVVQKKNGNLFALMRDSGDAPPRVHMSESADKGESWSTSVKSTIPNTASVELLVLKDGRWAFLGNDIDDGRNQLTLLLSDDEGQTWKWKTYLEKAAPNKGSFSYPCLIQAKDGMLHITYSYHLEKDKKSIKYMVINPEIVPLK